MAGIASQQSQQPQQPPTLQQPQLSQPAHPTQQSQSIQPSQPPFLTSTKQPSQWPVWDGSTTSLNAHLFLLRIKIEEDRAVLGSNRAICFDIFRSVPSDKQPRILNWLETGGFDSNYNWNHFLDHLRETYENKLTRQTAADQLGRIRMDATQYFVEYLQEYELKISQCGKTG
ncbi:BgTH12-07066 [Blumeria graminis f. sp. triticale]|uniref:BgTH12-07066 n=1 Tax=Blumeria graminis f. sp. triticale TaxID=1689686 RepID=A0A9W4GID7_BLUGR|nr:BgTH12-07066 [Blumeria graminis f. sp. triticale]